MALPQSKFPTQKVSDTVLRTDQFGNAADVFVLQVVQLEVQKLNTLGVHDAFGQFVEVVLPAQVGVLDGESLQDNTSLNSLP